MMVSASPSMAARSSLEEMLDSLRRRDETEKPKEVPPALPSRPTSKARLPSARRSLPSNFKSTALDKSPEWAPPSVMTKRKERDAGVTVKSKSNFGAKKTEKDVESPYVESEELQSRQKMAKPDWDGSVGYFIMKKLKVWCPLPSGLWESGTIESMSGDVALVSVSGGNAHKVQRTDLLPANPDVVEGVDDLQQLSFLNDPSVLSNLQCRFSQDVIYTKAGRVLIAMNPFKDVQICGEDLVRAYMKKQVDKPHVYAIADAAYNEMMRDDVNQSIIISGDTGAGKTETGKIAMQYLAALGGGGCGMEQAILQANCILEAFGNAKTSRNDNASRFGKLLELRFCSVGKICGAEIQTLFLEKSRVALVENGERSYHIFYQLCAGAPSMLKERLNLKMASDYNYLSQSDCLEIDGVDDAQKFGMLMEAFAVLRIPKEDQEQVFSLLAVVLWLGNVSFQVMEDDDHVEVLADEAITTASRLMGCSTQELMLALSTHDNVDDSISNRLMLQQATDARDALANFIYVNLFDWLVEQINVSLQVGIFSTGRSISILDIYGFESLQKSSFEQMCTNYANERLQQHFNRHLLKLEQEESELDGIDGTKVDFEDNQECLDLFEKKPSGLLSLLEEESNFPKATDLTLADKFKQHLNGNSCFKAEKSGSFSIRHHAGEVLYDTSGFLEKNRDSLSSVTIQLLSSCSSQLLQLFTSKVVLKQVQNPAAMSFQMNTLDSLEPSVGIKFKGQLFKLLHQLESSTPHFIRCIKPNNKQLPGVFEAEHVLQQLRCSVISEVVRISRSGYPTRMTHQEFAGRYGFLLSKANVSKDPLSLSIAILQQLSFLPEMYQIGYTKVYLRTGQIDKLEDKRHKVLRGIVGVQKYFRGYCARRHFRQKEGATRLQSNVPGGNAGRKADTPRTGSPRIDTPRSDSLRIDTAGTDSPRTDTPRTRRKSSRKFSDVKHMPSNVEELQRRVLHAEATLVRKEEENAVLQEQLQQFETRWSDYEEKMTSMQDVWQKQMSSLQMSLAAARKSLTSDNADGQPGRVDASSPRYDSEDALSVGSRTPGASTPINGVARETNGNLTAVGNLVKEFDQQRQTFDDEVKALIEVKPGSSDEELRKLRHRFESWKKEYKARLRETKSKLHKHGHKHGHSDDEKRRKKWWVI